MSQPSMRAILISGIPGAGKTTVARALAERLPVAASIEGDVLSFDFIRSGLPAPEDEQGWSQLMGLRRRQICLLADSYAEAGVLPVIDDVVTNPLVLDLYRKFLLLRPLLFVALVPRVEVVRRRDAGRDKHVFERWAHLDGELRSSLADVGLHIDSSDLTVDETVQAILSGIEQAKVLDDD
jgi:chloramphenicol 3-O-phosphotransferase